MAFSPSQWTLASRPHLEESSRHEIKADQFYDFRITHLTPSKSSSEASAVNASLLVLNRGI
jgi:hypothetical protein